EQIGAKLVQDAVIRATGKITARDRDGNISSEIKMIADEVYIVDDAELNSYESNGQKMKRPKASSKVQATRISGNRKARGSVSMPATTPPSAGPALEEYTVVAAEPLKKLFVHIKDPDDQEA